MVPKPANFATWQLLAVDSEDPFRPPTLLEVCDGAMADPILAQMAEYLPEVKGPKCCERKGVKVCLYDW
jgi:hypothetical protein